MQFQEVYQQLLDDNQMTGLSSLRVIAQNVQHTFPMAKIIPQFFENNLISNRRIIKQVLGDNDILQVFYFQLMKLCFEIQVEDKDYLQITKRILFTTDSLYGNNRKIKKCLAELFDKIANYYTTQFENQIDQHPFLDEAWIYALKQVLLVNGCQYKRSMEVLGFLCQIFQVEFLVYEDCYKFQQSDVFLYVEPYKNELYMTYNQIYSDTEYDQQYQKYNEYEIQSIQHTNKPNQTQEAQDFTQNVDPTLKLQHNIEMMKMQCSRHSQNDTLMNILRDKDLCDDTKIDRPILQPNNTSNGQKVKPINSLFKNLNSLQSINDTSSGQQKSSQIVVRRVAESIQDQFQNHSSEQMKHILPDQELLFQNSQETSQDQRDGIKIKKSIKKYETYEIKEQNQEHQQQVHYADQATNITQEKQNFQKQQQQQIQKQQRQQQQQQIQKQQRQQQQKQQQQQYQKQQRQQQHQQQQQQQYQRQQRQKQQQQYQRQQRQQRQQQQQQQQIQRQQKRKQQQQYQRQQQQQKQLYQDDKDNNDDLIYQPKGTTSGFRCITQTTTSKRSTMYNTNEMKTIGKHVDALLYERPDDCDDSKGSFYRQFSNSIILKMLQEPHKTKVDIMRNRVRGYHRKWNIFPTYDTNKPIEEQIHQAQKI